MADQQPTDEHKAIAERITQQVAGRFRVQVSANGLGDELLARLKSIVRNKMLAAGVPAWAVEMLMQGVEKALEQLLKATEPELAPIADYSKADV